MLIAAFQSASNNMPSEAINTSLTLSTRNPSVVSLAGISRVNRCHSFTSEWCLVGQDAQQHPKRNLTKSILGRFTLLVICFLQVLFLEIRQVFKTIVWNWSQGFC
jgi:hypothetical protein